MQRNKSIMVKVINNFMIVRSLPPIEHFDQLRKEVFDFIKKVNFDTNQIMCQTLADSQEDYKTGIGRIDELDHRDEKLYKFIQPDLKGTLIEQLITKYGGFRTRILKLGPKSCYSVHQDPTPRIHIPIVTSEQCWMVWPYKATSIHLKEGRAYWTNTTETHTFLNGDSELERIHIVMAVE